MFLSYEDFVTFEYHDRRKAFQKCVGSPDNTMDCMNSQLSVGEDKGSVATNRDLNDALLSVVKPKHNDLSNFKDLSNSKIGSQGVKNAVISNIKTKTINSEIKKPGAPTPKKVGVLAKQKVAGLPKKTGNATIYNNTAKPIEERIDDIVSRLTIDEIMKLAISTPEPVIINKELDITTFITKECSSGQSNSRFVTAFPNALAMAATFR